MASHTIYEELHTIQIHSYLPLCKMCSLYVPVLGSPSCTTFAIRSYGAPFGYFSFASSVRKSPNSIDLMGKFTIVGFFST